MINKFSPVRIGDYTFNCMQCGQKEWASKATILDVYTGSGGLIVCRECIDPIDYGIVPYKIPAEKPIPWSVDAMQTGNPSSITTYFPVFDYNVFDPMGTSPQQNRSIQSTWNNQLDEYWNQWKISWGTLQ